MSCPYDFCIEFLAYKVLQICIICKIIWFRICWTLFGLIKFFILDSEGHSNVHIRQIYMETQHCFFKSTIVFRKYSCGAKIVTIVSHLLWLFWFSFNGAWQCMNLRSRAGMLQSLSITGIYSVWNFTEIRDYFSWW